MHRSRLPVAVVPAPAPPAAPPRAEARRMLCEEFVDGWPGAGWRRYVRIGPYTPALACLKYGLVVELEDRPFEAAIEDCMKRDAYFNALGLAVLRFTSQEVVEEWGRVFRIILACWGRRRRKQDAPTARPVCH